MAKKMTAENIEKTLQDMVEELESLGTEIELKLKLASMDARDVWRRKLEPKLFEARAHAREAKDASKSALKDTIDAFRQFAESI